MDGRVGGEIALTMNDGALSDEEVLIPDLLRAAIGQSSIEYVLAYTPPRLFAFTWGGRRAGAVTIELHAQDLQVKLILTHKGLRGWANALDYAARWHAHLRVLHARLEGQGVPNFWTLLDKSKVEVRRLTGKSG